MENIDMFQVIPQIYFGENALLQLKSLPLNKVLFVVDPFLIHSGMAKEVMDIFTENQTEYLVFDKIKPDAPVSIVAAGLKALLDFKAKSIVALGGGSCIDTAKSIIYLSCENYGNKPFFAAIPTTCGTGSEVTAFSVIKAEERKVALINASMLPDMAILDVRFIKELPLPLIADTAVDALVHALEAYVSLKSNFFSDALAEKTVDLIFENLMQVMNEPTDQSARKNLLMASCMAGIAFQNANLGINHSLAHTLGAQFGIPHGRANGYFLKSVIQYNSSHSNTAAAKYFSLTRKLGLTPLHSKKGTDYLLEAISQLYQTVHMPCHLTEEIMPRQTYQARIPLMAQQALVDSCTLTNPCKPALQDLEKILIDLY